MRVFLGVLIALLSNLAFANSSQHGFIKISAERELYVDWTYAKGDKPTVILINGLTYSTKDWDRFTQALTAKGIGVLRYDPQGMGQTLLKYAPITENIKYQDQVKDLGLLIKALKLSGKLNLIGLSYGGGIAITFAAQNPELVKNLIVMAPYTEPVQTQDQWVASQIWLTRQSMPWNTATDEELYEYYYRQLVYATYPVAEPTVLKNPFILEATYRLALGIRSLNVKNVVGQLPAKSLHLIIAGQDQLLARDVLERFWNETPVSARASKVIFNNVDHKIPETAPHFSANYVEQILLDAGVMSDGREFAADPATGLVTYEGGNFHLPKGY